MGRRRDFGVVITDGTPTHPSFSVRWWEGTRQRRKRGFRTKTEASAFLASRRAALDTGAATVERRAETLFNDVGAEWLRLHSAQLRSHTENDLRWKKRVKPYFEGLTLAKVTPAKILEFKAELLADSKLANATRNQYLQLVRAVVRYAVSAGYLATAPTDRIRRFLIPLRRQRVTPPIEQAGDVGRFLEAVAAIATEDGCPSYPALFTTAVYTGLRRGEICGLRWSDVSFSERLMVVRRSYDGPTKSGKERVVPLPAPLVLSLKAWKLESSSRELVFPNDLTGEMYTKDAASRLRKVAAAACKRVGLRKIRFHDTRHLFASHMAMAGADLLTTSRILGHHSPTITSEIYSHLSPSHLVKESDRLRFEAPEGEVLPLVGNGEKPTR
jgi:integrase